MLPGNPAFLRPFANHPHLAHRSLGMTRGGGGAVHPTRECREEDLALIRLGQHPPMLQARKCPPFGAIGRLPILGQHGVPQAQTGWFGSVPSRTVSRFACVEHLAGGPRHRTTSPGLTGAIASWLGLPRSGLLPNLLRGAPLSIGTCSTSRHPRGDPGRPSRPFCHHTNPRRPALDCAIRGR